VSGPTPPPGVLGQVSATSVLVLAPHYDDEVLGCWRLIAQRAERRGRGPRRLPHRQRRRPRMSAGRFPPTPPRAGREADAAARRARVAGAEHLGFPDGAPSSSIFDGAAAGSDRARSAQASGPELVLVPSPLEATSDHRAAFVALFRVLSAVPRPGDPLAPVRRGADRDLLYEINHPGYPNLLLDVGEQMAGA
jgi:LmbE family N-acetylglucosaminyl deacetylase